MRLLTSDYQLFLKVFVMVVASLVIVIDAYFSSPGWPRSAACQPLTSWMIVRCARCCLIWSRPTMPSTASSTPPKAFTHRGFSSVWNSDCKISLLKRKCSTFCLWLSEGSEVLRGEVLCSLCVSPTLPCSLSMPESFWCCEMLHWPLFCPKLCDNSLFTPPKTVCFYLSTVISKGLILYLR